MNLRTQVIHQRDFVAIASQPRRNMGSDESQSSRDENSIHIPLFQCPETSLHAGASIRLSSNQIYAASKTANMMLPAHAKRESEVAPFDFSGPTSSAWRRISVRLLIILALT
jgi:hypothetical protein